MCGDAGSTDVAVNTHRATCPEDHTVRSLNGIWFMTGRLISSTLALLVLLPLRAPAQEVPPAVRTAAACAPAGNPPPSDAPRVTASGKKINFATGEAITIDRGSDDGLDAGQRYLVRRPMHFQGAPNAEFTIGWLHVTSATPSTATAQVDFTCDTVTAGDHLEPFSELALPPESIRTFVGGKLNTDRAIRLSYGSDGRSLFGNSDFVLADGGQDQGVAAGARYAVVRLRSDTDTTLAEAVVVAVYDDQSLLYFTSVRDAVFTGDMLALRVGARDPSPASGSRMAMSGAPNPPNRPAPTIGSSPAR